MIICILSVKQRGNVLTKQEFPLIEKYNKHPVGKEAQEVQPERYFDVTHFHNIRCDLFKTQSFMHRWLMEKLLSLVLKGFMAVLELLLPQSRKHKG